MAEEPADAVRRQVALPAVVDDERATPGASEHERGAEAGGAAADHDAVPGAVHASIVTAQPLMWQPDLPCRQSDDGRRRAGAATSARAAHRRGLTLQQVAAAAHIDVSTLSRLETGKRRLALDHIPALAGALGVTTDELLGPAPRQDPRVRGKPRRFEGMTMWPLTNRGPAPGVHAFRIEISARRTRPPAVLPVHDGHDWMYVLDGRLRLRARRRTT